MVKKGSGSESRLGCVESGSAFRSPVDVTGQFSFLRDAGVQRAKNSADAGEKAAIELNHANETLKVFLDCRCRKIADSFDLRRKRRNTGSGNPVAQKVKRRDSKHTLVDVDGETVRIEESKNGSEMGSVFIWGSARHEYIVYVREDIRDLAKDGVH